MGNLESTDGGPGEPPSVPLLLPPGKTPMPEPCELEERFALVLSSMNLPPDKARLLRQYDNEKKPIKTKFRLPVFNWTALKPNQINGTVFSELDDEKILEDLDLDRFEELFKTKAQGPALDLICSKNKTAQKAASKVTLLEASCCPALPPAPLP